MENSWGSMERSRVPRHRHKPAQQEAIAPLVHANTRTHIRARARGTGTRAGVSLAASDLTAPRFPWASSKAGSLSGVALVVRGCTKRPSQRKDAAHARTHNTRTPDWPASTRSHFRLLVVNNKILRVVTSQAGSLCAQKRRSLFSFTPSQLAINIRFRATTPDLVRDRCFEPGRQASFPSSQEQTPAGLRRGVRRQRKGRGEREASRPSERAVARPYAHKKRCAHTSTTHTQHDHRPKYTRTTYPQPKPRKQHPNTTLPAAGLPVPSPKLSHRFT